MRLQATVPCPDDVSLAVVSAGVGADAAGLVVPPTFPTLPPDSAARVGPLGQGCQNGVVSIAVTIPELFDELFMWGPALVVTVGDDGVPRLVTINPVVVEIAGQLAIRLHGPGRSTLANVERTGPVSLYFAAVGDGVIDEDDDPAASSRRPGPAGYSLIVDGRAKLGPDGESIDVAPISAVRHRPPPPPPSG